MKNAPLNPERNEKGFTLAELLIVVAIIGVLVSISIPIFNAQMEKARQAVDMHTARSIESVLAASYNSGEIQLPNGYSSAFVMICRDPASAPWSYKENCFDRNPSESQTCWCGADKDVTVNGQKSANWDAYNSQMVALLTEAGLDPKSLCTRSNGKDDGWDWISIQIGQSADGTLTSRIFSGKKGATASSKEITSLTNIEKKIYGLK